MPATPDTLTSPSACTATLLITLPVAFISWRKRTAPRPFDNAAVAGPSVNDPDSSSTPMVTSVIVVPFKIVCSRTMVSDPDSVPTPSTVTEPASIVTCWRETSSEKTIFCEDASPVATVSSIARPRPFTRTEPFAFRLTRSPKPESSTSLAASRAKPVEPSADFSINNANDPFVRFRLVVELSPTAPLTLLAPIRKRDPCVSCVLVEIISSASTSAPARAPTKAISKVKLSSSAILTTMSLRA